MENNEESLKTDELINEELEHSATRKPKANMKKDGYKNKECKVIHYDKQKKTLDVLFDRYGLRIFNVEAFSGNTVIVKYKNEIGNPDFEYKL